VELKKVEFSQEERDFYSKLEADSRAQFQVWSILTPLKGFEKLGYSISVYFHTKRIAACIFFFIEALIEFLFLIV
jgi:hypothetical protein